MKNSVKNMMIAAAIAGQLGGATVRLRAATVPAPSHNPASGNQVITAVASHIGGTTASSQAAIVPVPSDNGASENLSSPR
jgi:hypothetical protein